MKFERFIHSSMVIREWGERLGFWRDEKGVVWSGMRKDVINSIRGCPSCQKSRSTVKESFQGWRHVTESCLPFEEVFLLHWWCGELTDLRMMRGSEIYWLLLITSQNSLNYFQFGQWMLQCQLQGAWFKYLREMDTWDLFFLGLIVVQISLVMFAKLYWSCGAEQILTVG
jgi:hypothetical protein